MDVVTATDLVTGLNSGEGMRGAAEELYDVEDADFSNQEWKQMKSLCLSKGG